MGKNCHSCGETWEGSPGSQPGKSEACPKCGADLHCCLNCRFYDPSAHHECRSSTTEHVRDKEKRNYCDEFEFGHNGGIDGGGSTPQDDLSKKWNDLFK